MEKKKKKKCKFMILGIFLGLIVGHIINPDDWYSYFMICMIIGILIDETKGSRSKLK